jgi:hypothetical protein
MPQIEINSPLTGSQHQLGFRVSGWTSESNHSVSCSIAGAAGNQSFSVMSDAFGNWNTVASSVPVGNDYTVTARITVDTDTFSDVNEGVDVCSPINTAPKPIPIEISGIGRAKTGRAGMITVSGHYSSPPNPDWILVQVLIMRRKKSSRVFSAGVINSPSGNAWTITLPVPPASNQRHVVVKAIRVQGNNKVSGITTMRV